MARGCTSLLATRRSDGQDHTIAVVVDAGVQLVSFVVDGLLCDGGGASSTGFAWTNPQLGQV